MEYRPVKPACSACRLLATRRTGTIRPSFIDQAPAIADPDGHEEA